MVSRPLSYWEGGDGLGRWDEVRHYDVAVPNTYVSVYAWSMRSPQFITREVHTSILGWWPCPRFESGFASLGVVVILAGPGYYVLQQHANLQEG